MLKRRPSLPDNPFGLEVVTDRETLRFHATAGARLTYSDPDGRFSVTGAGQYYYNGEGYDGEFSKANSAGDVFPCPTGESCSHGYPVDRASLRRACRSAGRAARSRISAPSAFWLGNLSDGSGMISLSLGYTGWKDISPSIGISRTYGDAGSEYAPLTPTTRFTVESRSGEAGRAEGDWVER